MNQIKEQLDSFLDLTPDEDWPHQYHAEEINSYYKIIEYLFSDTSIDLLIFPIADGGVAIQYEENKLVFAIKINIDTSFILYMCYDKINKNFKDSFKIPLTFESQTIVKNKITKNHEKNQKINQN